MPKPPIPLRRTLAPLAIATLAGLVILIAPVAMNGHAASLGFVLYVGEISFFAYVTAALCVLPVFAVWPAARRPHLIVAAVWGAAGTVCANYVLVGRAIVFMSLRNVAFAALPGALSGLCYVWLVRRQRT